MKPSNVKLALTTCINAGEPAFLRGQPGIGKTSVVHQVSEAMGRRCIVSRLALMEPVDVRGLPVVDEAASVTRWLTPHDFPKAGCEPTNWFLDEWPQAMPSVQNAAGQILNERRIGDYVLPDNVVIVAAGNRAKDRAATSRMPSHIADRFTFLDVDFDLDDWSRQMLAVGTPLPVVAFGRFRPELICAFDPNADVSPTPRGWEKIGKLLTQKPAAEVELDLYTGKVGQAAAIEFTGFLRVWRTLPSVDAILLNPDKEDVPPESQGSTRYALCGALARKSSEANFDRVLRYGQRMGGDFGACLVKMAVGRNRDLQNTKAFIGWAAANPDVMV